MDPKIIMEALANKAQGQAPRPDGNQRILPRHRQIIELALGGASNVEIAAAVGMTPVGVGLVLRSTVVQDEIARRRASIERKQDQAIVNYTSLTRQTLEQAGTDAAELLAEQVNDTQLPPPVRQRAAEKILSKVLKTGGETAGQGSIITIEQLNLIQQTIVESGVSTTSPKPIESVVRSAALEGPPVVLHASTDPI